MTEDVNDIQARRIQIWIATKTVSEDIDDTQLLDNTDEEQPVESEHPIPPELPIVEEVEQMPNHEKFKQKIPYSSRYGRKVRFANNIMIKFF